MAREACYAMVRHAENNDTIPDAWYVDITFRLAEEIDTHPCNKVHVFDASQRPRPGARVVALALVDAPATIITEADSQFFATVAPYAGPETQGATAPTAEGNFTLWFRAAQPPPPTSSRTSEDSPTAERLRVPADDGTSNTLTSTTKNTLAAERLRDPASAGASDTLTSTTEDTPAAERLRVPACNDTGSRTGSSPRPRHNRERPTADTPAERLRVPACDGTNSRADGSPRLRHEAFKVNRAMILGLPYYRAEVSTPDQRNGDVETAAE